ncbi:MAG: hypothetical protein ACRCVY_08335 [Commensalibacter sp.]
MNNWRNSNHIGNRIEQMDLWLLDRVFQPVADRLPERFSALSIGMNLQLGALFFSAACLLLLLIFFKMELITALIIIAIWCFGLFFYIGICRVHQMVKIGTPNPFRFMLLGIRPISIALSTYDLWRSLTIPFPLCFPLFLNGLGSVVFVLGLYFISCQLNPPKKRTSYKISLKKKLNASLGT